MGHFKEKFQVQGTQKEAVQQKRSRARSTNQHSSVGLNSQLRRAWSHVEVNSESCEIRLQGELYLSDSGVWAFELKRGGERLSFITGLTGCRLIILQKVTSYPLDAFTF